jgi:hypothetical protein
MMMLHKVPVNRQIKPNPILISLSDLVQLIRNNPQRVLVEEIRQLRLQGKEKEVNFLKQNNLYFVNPNYNLDSTGQSVGSGFIYLDIDTVEGDIEKYRESFIEKYGHLVSMVCLSSSGRGLSILVPVNHSINNTSTFKRVYRYVASLFGATEFDHAVGHLKSNWFLSGDENVYYNNSSPLIIDDLIQDKDCDGIPTLLEPDVNEVDSVLDRLGLVFSDQGGSRDNYKVNIIHRMNPSTINNSETEFIQVLSKYQLETNIELNDLVHFEGIPYRKIFIRKVHPDGTKRKSYTKYIHDLLYLNPNMFESDLYLILYMINQLYARPRMDTKLLEYIVSSQFEVITNLPDYQYSGRTMNRLIHYQDRKLIPQKKRKSWSNKMRGFVQQHQTSQTIDGVQGYCVSHGIRCTKKFISDNTGLSISTIKRYLKKNGNQIEEQRKNLEEQIYQEVTEIYLERGEWGNDFIFPVTGSTYDS